MKFSLFSKKNSWIIMVTNVHLATFTSSSARNPRRQGGAFLRVIIIWMMFVKEDSSRWNLVTPYIPITNTVLYNVSTHRYTSSYAKVIRPKSVVNRTSDLDKTDSDDHRC